MRTLTHNGCYVVRTGDTLSQIAEEFKSTVEELMAFNSSIHQANLILPGMYLKLPIHCVELYVERLAADGEGFANEGRRLYKLCEQYGAKAGNVKTWLEQVLACLDRPLPIPDGYQLVPKMLTPVMRDQIVDRALRDRRQGNWPANCWEGALAAAPIPVLPLREAIRLNIERAQKAAGHLSDKAIENALVNPLTSEQVGEMLFDPKKMDEFFKGGSPFKPQVEYGILNDPKVGSIPTTSSFDVDALADILYKAGWREHTDSKKDGLRKAMPYIAELLIKQGTVQLESAATQRLQKLLDEAQECIDHQRKTLIQQAKAVDETNTRIVNAESILDQMERYLSRTDREQIVSGSTFHKEIRTLLGYTDPVLQQSIQDRLNSEAPSLPEVPQRAPTSEDCKGEIGLEHRWVDSAGGHGRQFCHKCGAVRGPQLETADKIDWALNFLSKYEAQQPDEF